MLKALPGAALLLVLFGGAVPGGAIPLDQPYDLYEIGPLADAELRAFSAAPGPWVSLHQERAEQLTWVLLALPDGTPANPPAGSAARPRYLGRVRDGERVVLSAPVGAGETRLRTGRPVTITPSGGTVHVTTDRPGQLALRGSHQFRLLERSSPPPPPRAEGPPAAFAGILERSGRGLARVDQRDFNAVDFVVQSVNGDSLEAHVRALSEESSGSLTSRWWEDQRTEGVHRQYIRDHLQEALTDSGAVRVFEHEFEVPSEESPGTMISVHNIVGFLPSPVDSRGAILLTAHYDATGFRNDPDSLCVWGFKDDEPACDCGNAAIDPDCEWRGASDPAPGADDNATGVAAILEAARLLAPLTFDFDLYFVAFQAEEIGLIGSAVFADSVAGADQEIFAVLNLDMLGYNALRNELDVMTDESSEWLADWVVESGGIFVPSLPLEKYLEPFGRSDHASFWARGIDAVVLLEDKELPYPGYHRVTDTWSTMVDHRLNSEQQLKLATQLGVATVARFALHYVDRPDLAIPAGEVEARPLDSRLGFVRGQIATLTASVHNLGDSSLEYLGNVTDSLTARVRFHDGHPDSGGVMIDEVIRKDFYGAGSVTEFEITWDTSNATPGFHEIWAVVEGLDDGYDLQEVNRDNNRAATTVFMQARADEGPLILSHYAYPNPAPSGARLGFYYELSKNAAVKMLIFDLEGTLVSQLSADLRFIADGNRAGANRIGAAAFSPDLDKIDLESGVYLYVLKVGDGNQFTDIEKGKFAIVN